MTPQYHCVCRSRNAWEHAGSCTCTNIMTQQLRLLVSFATFVLINKCTLKLFLMIRILGTTIPCYLAMLTLLTIGIGCEDRFREPNLMVPLLPIAPCSFLSQSTRVRANGLRLKEVHSSTFNCESPVGWFPLGEACPQNGSPKMHWLGLRLFPSCSLTTWKKDCYF